MDEIFKQLGYTGTLIVCILPVVLGSILIFLKGFKFKNFEISGILKPKSQDPNKFRMKVGDDFIGFEIPKLNVKIYGKSWNKDHVYIYRQLEDRWRDCKFVDITESNITSTLISLLEDKYQKFGELTIYAAHEQLALLSYLQQYQKIQIESR